METVGEVRKVLIAGCTGDMTEDLGRVGVPAEEAMEAGVEAYEHLLALPMTVAMLLTMPSPTRFLGSTLFIEGVMVGAAYAQRVALEKERC